MFQILPPEIWMNIYNYLVFLCARRSELVPYMLIHKLAYHCIQPRLFETLIQFKSNTLEPFPLDVLFRLPRSTQKECIKRVFIGDSPRLADGMRALDLGVESIERLRCALSPKADLLSTISALKNMTWLEAPVQIVAALQKCAATLAPIQWQKSLNTLLIIYLGDNFNSESADYPTFDAALQSLDLTWLPGLRQLVIFDWMDDIETRNHIIGLLQKCPSAELIILVSDDYLTVDYGHRILPTDDKRLVYYLTSTRLNDRALEASWTSLRESAFYVLHRRLPYIYRDNPFDDWGEITYCKGMHIWQWARAAQKEGKNIRTRPMELVEE